jgi:hypothetical protein
MRVKEDPQAYAIALRDPLSPMSMGARVPRPYYLPTTTMHTRIKQYIKSDANGDFSFAILGHPLHTMWAGTGVVSGGLAKYTQNNVYAAEGISSLQSKFSEYRLVAAGVELHNLQPASTGIGVISIARVPLAKTLPTPAMLENVAATASNLLPILCGVAVDSGGNVPLGIQDLPGAEEYSIDELLGRRIKCACTPISGSAFDMKNTSDAAYNATTTLADTVLITDSTNTVDETVAGTSDVSSGDGWTCILVRGSGFPASSAAPVLEMYIGLHVEGVSAVSTVSTGGSALVPDSKRESRSTLSMDKILSYASKLDVANLVDKVKHVALGVNAARNGNIAGVQNSWRALMAT